MNTRKIFSIIIGLLLLLILTACNNNKDIEIIIGPSENFTEEEIQSGIDLVIKDFNFPDCKLKKVEYDEDISKEYAKDYKTYGRGLENEISEDNILILLSDFQVAEKSDNPVLEAGELYKDYQWILIREDENSKWLVDDWGY